MSSDSEEITTHPGRNSTAEQEHKETQSFVLRFAL